MLFLIFFKLIEFIFNSDILFLTIIYRNYYVMLK